MSAASGSSCTVLLNAARIRTSMNRAQPMWRQPSEADVVFHNGLNLETGGNGWFKKLVKTSHKEFDKDVFAASKGVTAQHLTTNTKEQDPHAWLDLANGIQYVKTITKVLKQKDAKNALLPEE